MTGPASSRATRLLWGAALLACRCPLAGAGSLSDTQAQALAALREASPETAPIALGAAQQRIPATVLERALEDDEALARGFAVAAGAVLSSEQAQGLRSYVAACLRARLVRLDQVWPAVARSLLDRTLRLLLVDPERFVAQATFREKVIELLAREIGPPAAPALRDRLLFELNQVRGLDFPLSEILEHGWGGAARRALERQRPAIAGAWPAEDGMAPIEASIFSLNLLYTEPEEAGRFLEAVARAHPERRILVLADLPLREALAGRGVGARVTWLETYGRGYSAWPRDPFTLLRRPDGGVALLARPDAQAGREEDHWMAAELVQTLPDTLDAQWRMPTWTFASLPFHNGQLLFTPDAVWVSLHSLERRILQRLGLPRVPQESFATATGRRRYLDAAREAAREYATLLGRPVRFVHALPRGDEPRAGAQLDRLGGGAGYDLDSIVTLLPRRDKPPAALVADLDEARLLLRAEGEEWAALASAFRFQLPGEALRERTRALHDSPRGRRLDAFLELVAAELEREGFEVLRLPLLLVPTAGHPEREALRDPFFLLTWNNVVAESGTAGASAEGFSNAFPTGDRLAEERFSRAGFALRLYPPLVASVLRNGGYRCASNHLRRVLSSVPSGAEAR